SSDLEVPLVLAVQVGLDDVPGNLGRHDATLRATLCNLLATVLETTPRSGTSNLAQALFLGPPQAGDAAAGEPYRKRRWRCPARVTDLPGSPGCGNTVREAASVEARLAVHLPHVRPGRNPPDEHGNVRESKHPFPSSSTFPAAVPSSLSWPGFRTRSCMAAPSAPSALLAAIPSFALEA